VPISCADYADPLFPISDAPQEVYTVDEKSNKKIRPDAQDEFIVYFGPKQIPMRACWDTG
jgi:hypothetical protein